MKNCMNYIFNARNMNNIKTIINLRFLQIAGKSLTWWAFHECSKWSWFSKYWKTFPLTLQTIAATPASSTCCTIRKICRWSLRLTFFRWPRQNHFAQVSFSKVPPISCSNKFYPIPASGGVSYVQYPRTFSIF